MAGTNRKIETEDGDWARFLPAVILVAPQMGENIGASARAMKNCGLRELHIVAPRDGWPNAAAQSMAAGGEDILERAQLHDTLDEAAAPFTMIAATTARKRDMVKPSHEPDAAAEVLAGAARTEGGRTALLFGPERSGLDNDAIALADFIITVPLNPAFSSLNLGQAVLLMGWAMRRHLMQGEDNPARDDATDPASLPASAEEKRFFFTALEEHLEEGGFFTSPDMRPQVMRNITAMFLRAGLSRQEVSTLRGMLKAIARSGKG